MVENPKPAEIKLEALLQETAGNAKAFQAIGAFIFQFSQLEFTIRALLSARLQLKETLFDIVTAPYDFQILCTVTRETLLLQWPDQKSEITAIFKRCLALNDDRVRIAHGAWANDGNAIIARHVARSSLKPHYFFKDSDEIARLTEAAQKLMAEFLFVLGVPKDNEPDEGTPI